MSTFIQAMNSMTTGVNGADVVTPTGLKNPLLVLFSSFVRGQDEEEFKNMVRESYKFDPLNTVVAGFYCRDILEGCGERKLFYIFLDVLHELNPFILTSIMSLIPEYGACFDIYRGLPLQKDANLLRDASGYYVVQMETTDKELWGKWAPRENSAYHFFAKAIVKHLRGNWKLYRKMCSDLNRQLGTVETKMCSDATGQSHWADINPSSVPSLCLKKHRKAFLNEGKNPSSDADRLLCREKFLAHLSKKMKVHGARLMPHEFAIQYQRMPYMSTEEISLIDSQFNDLVEKTLQTGALGKAVVMADFSGSMSSGGDKNIRPIHVSMGLSLLISRVVAPAFRGHVMAFEAKPYWISLPVDKPASEVFSIMERHSQGYNTDILKAFDLILERMKQCRVPIGEEPDDFIILTDMGWDGLNDNTAYVNFHSKPWTTHVELLKDGFKRAGQATWPGTEGWRMPRLIIWNVSGNYKEYHHTGETEGVFLISGWSSAILKYFVGGEDVISKLKNPVENMMSILESPRYDRVRALARMSLL